MRPKIRREGKGTWKEIEWGYCGVLIGGGCRKFGELWGKNCGLEFMLTKRGMFNKVWASVYYFSV